MPDQGSATDNQFISVIKARVILKVCKIFPQLTCENWAKVRSANMGTWPRSSWTQSLKRNKTPHRLVMKQQRTETKRSHIRLRFGRVHGGGRVSDVLGALEHPERQTGQEISG